jgi:hypothetical protein
VRRAIAALLLAVSGCATSGPRRVPDSDPRVASAMTYARDLLRTIEPVPVRWYTLRGDAVSGPPESMWCKKGTETQRYAGGRTQYLDSYTRIVVYVGPKGEQNPIVWPHEAVHAVGRDIIAGDHPPKTTTGIKLRGVVPYW